MKQISQLDLYFLLKEFKFLENERIDNFYLEDEVFYMKVYARSKGNIFITNKISKFIYLDTFKNEVSNPSSFIQHLRKYLKSGFIRCIEQIPSERIIKIEIEKKEEEDIIKYYLFIELFSGGNIILTDSNLNIKNALEKKTFKDRKIKVKSDYELPPNKELSVYNFEEDKFKEEFNNSDLILVKFLAIKLGLGGKYSEYVCSKAEIPFDLMNITDSQVINIRDEIQKLLNMDLKACIAEDDFYPFEKESKDIIYFPSFNDAIKTYYSKFLKNEDKKEKEIQILLNKLLNRLEKQESQFIENEKDYEKYNSIGNKIYENYAQIEYLLKQIDIALKEKGEKFVIDSIKNSENPILKKIIQFNPKKREIKIELN